ncbi:MAG: hypothetical protein KME04_09765 [Pleurocapsa minor GSE-CHR-MK-17-07R]|nr:hypothetical protein [Pleurocapsa minor GSE-CHR-MK 17-07R]
MFNSYSDVHVQEQRRKDLIERAKLERLAREAEAKPERVKRGLARLLDDLRRMPEASAETEPATSPS